MELVLQILHAAAVGGGVLVIVLLCIAGIVLSCLSLSGTWLVAVAAVLAAVALKSDFPGIWTILAFVLASGLVEAVEAFAGSVGVLRRGGSKLAGVAAAVGGIVGMVLGSMVPVPVAGTLLGMLVGSFALVFAVERHRLKKSAPAAGIAWGAVTARILVLFLKVSVTLGMTGFLFAGLAVRR